MSEKQKAVYTIVESPGSQTGRKQWIRIGSATVNRDGSLNVRLDAFPTNGTLHIRDAGVGIASPDDKP